MENAIINRAKILIYEQGKDIDVAILQAIQEFGDVEELSKIYAMYEITFEDYVESIKRKVKEGSK